MINWLSYGWPLLSKTYNWKKSENQTESELLAAESGQDPECIAWDADPIERAVDASLDFVVCMVDFDFVSLFCFYFSAFFSLWRGN